jgi:hypothetical protein
MILAAISLTLSALEVTAYLKGGGFSIVSSRVWFIMLIGYICISIWVVASQLFKDISSRIWYPAAILMLLITFSLWGVNNTKILVDSESALQVDAGLTNFTHLDWGYTTPAFLGYPSRQYLVIAIPSLVFGRNLVNLRLGYGLILSLGIALFYVALRTIFPERNGFTSGLAMLFLLGSPAFIGYLKHYEQSIIPISLTMQSIGWVVFIIKKKNILGALSLIWIGSMLATSYTPGLGSWILLCGSIGYLAYHSLFKRNFRQLFFYISCLLTILVFGLSSFITRTDILNRAIRTGGTFGSSIIETFRIFELVVQTNSESIFGPLMITWIILYLVLAIVGIWDYKHMAIALWSILIILSAGFMRGFASPPAEASIHRALIILPVLIIGSAAVFSSLINKLELPVVAIISIGIFLWGMYIYSQQTYVKESPERTALLVDIISYW